MSTEPDPTSDRELLRAWKGGDRSAGATLFERHYDSVARFFVNKLGTDCDDVIQATFLGCVEAIERFRGEASFRTLLFAIARNQLYKHLDALTRTRARFDSATVSLAELGPSVVTLMGERREHQLLLTALRRLPVDAQMMLELHYWEGLPVREIAVVFDAPINTVKTRMRRARLRLEQELERLANGAEELANTIDGLDRWAEELRARLDPPA